jgi:hypothetical protein
MRYGPLFLFLSEWHNEFKVELVSARSSDFGVPRPVRSAAERQA